MSRNKKNPPDFIIAGFPKCGTSFIHFYLSEHNNIWMPNFEPVHFCSDLNANSLYRNKEDYTRIFKDIQNSDHIITGEKSSNYACSDFAIDRIYENNKNTKIIITLRNPIEAVISYHNHNVRMGYETIIDLEEAILAQEKRRTSSYKIPYFAKHEKKRYAYYALFSFPKKIKMFLRKYGEQNVKIIFLDDIVKNQQKTMDDIFEFLGVNSITKKRETKNKTNALVNHSKFKVKLFYNIHYANRQINNMDSKNYLLNNIIVKIVLKFFFKVCLIFIKHPYAKKNNNIPIKPSKKAYSLLFNHFNAEIDELSILLNKDLTHWKNNIF